MEPEPQVNAASACNIGQALLTGVLKCLYNFLQKWDGPHNSAGQGVEA